MERSERELVLAAQLDGRRFEALYRMYRQKIYHYFWFRLSHHDQLAEDFTQETFLRAFAALPRYRPGQASYYTYLLTIAHNLLVSHYRKVAPLPLESVNHVGLATVSDAHRQIDRDLLWRVVGQLKPVEREVLLLRYRQELSLREIARVLGRTPNAVKVLLHRTRAKLRRYERLPVRLTQPAPRSRYTPPRFLTTP